MNSSYIEGLEPGATVKGVFDNVCGQASDILAELDRRRDRRYTENDPIIPNLPLELRWSAALNESSTYVVARYNLATRSLLRITRQREDNGGPVTPVEVAGFRNREIAADYVLADKLPKTEIECRLGGFGMRGAARDHSEPLGKHTAQYGMGVEQLAEHEKQRLGLVAQSIVDAVAAVEMLIDGESLINVFEALGRALPARN